MEVNWFILGTVAVFVVILLVYLIRKDQKDKKKVVKFFGKDYKSAYEKESELNDEDDEY